MTSFRSVSCSFSSISRHAEALSLSCRAGLPAASHVQKRRRLTTSTRSRLLAASRIQEGRRLTNDARLRDEKVGFLLDIDGVLTGGDVGERGRQAIAWLQKQRHPFVLMTNGGGASTLHRAQMLSEQLAADPPLTTANVVQAHSPMGEALTHLRNKRVYVVGAKEGAWQEIASELQLNKAENAGTLIAADPTLWSFRDPSATPANSSREPFAGVVVVHDSRDWGCDTQILIDILSSREGTIGNPKDASDASQWTEDQQIPLYFSNGDLLWKSAFSEPRLGQAAFRVAFEAVFEAVTGHKVYSQTFGKPTKAAYEHALALLNKQASALDLPAPRRVVMVGDNPESDIAGANNAGVESVLVKTGVYTKGEPAHRPTTIQEDVMAALAWAVEQQ